METLRDLDIVRAMPMGVEFRAATDGETLGIMQGHFSVFNVWYEVNSIFEGQFLERVAPGTYERTIREDAQSMKVQFDHGHDPQIGNKLLGVPETVREDTKGPFYEVPLFDTSYNRDLLPGLKAGAYGSSMRFRVTSDAWDDEPAVSEHNPQGIPERTITGARVFEFGPVTWPANPAATAGMRSMTDEFYANVRKTSPDYYDELVARSQDLRNRRGALGAPGAPEALGASDQTLGVGLTREERDRALYLITL